MLSNKRIQIFQRKYCSIAGVIQSGKQEFGYFDVGLTTSFPDRRGKSERRAARKEEGTIGMVVGVECR